MSEGSMERIENHIIEIDYLINNLGSNFRPNQKHLARLFEIYKLLNPRENPCFTCRGDRINVVKWFKSKI
jgi:hypothetical protein